ncbi:unnamed protein product [Microthlaspi erraticum]|uniref:Helitron helicase-like domain-containing protein n=1 Tax=Microthlaspi erraticum TaxID=1685480 RepID=A0A6D2IAP2_9BRAS|nr:unnamed protein product [Microthlaspi erraticum]
MEKDNPIMQCTYCNALVWYSEKTGEDRDGAPTFTICCQQGRVKLPPLRKPPPYLENLLANNPEFRRLIRVYNSILAFTSIGAKIDYSIIIGLDPCFQLPAKDRYKANQIEDLTIRLVGRKGKGKQYDLPQVQEVAGLIVGDLTATTGYRDIVLQLHSSHLQEIRDDHPLFMSLQYPLFFHPEIPHAVTQQGERKRSNISTREYYAYQLQTRLTEGMTIVKGGRLFHQYAVDAYTAIEQKRLQWARDNQEQLRADLYNNVFDAVGKGETEGTKIGKRIILPSSFTGGPRYMIEKYHDAMAICRHYGNPTLFITMTANPNWDEIKEHIAKHGETAGNQRPDMETRVFEKKLGDLLKDLEKGLFFSPYIAALHTVEFQKQGLPHAHMLIWLKRETTIPTPDEVNKIISAELPNKEEDPIGFELVEKHMMHGPCGVDRPSSPCMSKKFCTKKYPRQYNEFTSIDKSGYIIYRCRHNEASIVKKGVTNLDNRFVIPHNLEILKKYQAHINVEWCNTTNAIKYLFKYITKGVDKATFMIEKGTPELGDEKFKVVKERNEIQEFLDCRFLSACEAMWRIFAFHIHKGLNCLYLSKVPQVTEVPCFSKDGDVYLQFIFAVFSIDDTLEVNKVERVAYDDVKAVEYFLKQKFESQPEIVKVGKLSLCSTKYLATLDNSL